ncbi:MAG: nickel pincer cofactor biosynthesis protein LarB [Candidatus Riflebacteria bacterium]|nr:nickel pincer cofactor biosynthesis protein LarB [Candidatus Riflebacteria bacterium]
MKKVDLRIVRILENYKNGKISASEATRLLSTPATPGAEPVLHETVDNDIELPDAVLDVDRERRIGFPEAIYAAGKKPQQVSEIFARLFEANGKALATRCSDEAMDMLAIKCPQANIDRTCGLAWAVSEIQLHPSASIAIIAAGTSDLPIAEEAALTLEFCGYSPERIYDVGVAGIHRLLKRVPRFKNADAVIVVAGMEGALPSVVGGLVGCPVIAVPTSVGYGASFNGLAALLGMLNSCSAGVTVVNIDNGFGAAAAAVRIIKGL